tara:strand:+ start:1700 stop:2356 length:657 start_codon:yes stop_codon:yes gene_type:complete
MAFRQIINKVLTRLREDTITSDWTGDVLDSDDVDDYQKLISEFVNESKQLVEDSWGWGVLRTIETVATSNGTASYTLSNLNDRSRILQVIDDTNDAVLSQMSDELFYRYTYVGTTQSGNPSYFRLKNNEISFWPTPDAAYNIRVHAVQPQDDLGTAASTLKCPEHIVVLGAYALAIAERGEDGGLNASSAGLRFQDALSDAIVQDQNRTVNETTWYAS